jgi:hypothetical protein
MAAPWFQCVFGGAYAYVCTVLSPTTLSLAFHLHPPTRSLTHHSPCPPGLRDVHHCKGTSEIFDADPNVLVISLHRYGRHVPACCVSVARLLVTRRRQPAAPAAAHGVAAPLTVIPLPLLLPLPLHPHCCCHCCRIAVVTFLEPAQLSLSVVDAVVAAPSTLPGAHLQLPMHVAGGCGWMRPPLGTVTTWLPGTCWCCLSLGSLRQMSSSCRQDLALQLMTQSV